ncbi:2-oxoglutarate-dependent dioxygenase AOP3-like [Olea europaea subsp. europaea]|uniref:2-oxoglutarate-dependent dioxygenase AOP3-like n=1 Tax=Olea europaea subsp. europaea TaxID=158383 RepID=A0A8S0T4B7_OLEEU|nr:2-oxoglutarate-dependent dioxygenase AOP3-like [Olea europaea subsp. europaea]
MGSYAEFKLPIVEFNEKNLIPGTESWESTSHSVRHALEKYGCFIALHEKITTEMHDAMFKSAMPLYDVPTERKQKLECNFLGSGYGSNYPRMPLCEFFGIENGTNIEGTKNFASLMWPEGNDQFCETTASYCKLLSELEDAITRMVFSSYGVEKYFEAFTQSSFFLTKFMKYRVPKENEINMGLVPHIDKTIFGLIDTNTKGLEIETRDGEWINFEPSPNTFLVIAGEIFTAWSNGRIYAPIHKVVITGDKAKYSVGQFLFSNATMEVPPELVDEENPLKFKPFNHLEFLKYCKEGGQTTLKSAIETYCGI